MTYIFKNLTKNKIKALFYIISSNQDFKEHIKPEEFTEDDGLFRGIQAMDSYNEYAYTLYVSKDNCIHISNIDGLLNIKYDISELRLVVTEYDGYLNSIFFENCESNCIGVWKRKINPTDSDLDWHKFLEYAKLFADEVR